MRWDDSPPEPLASAPGFLLSWNGQRMARKFAAAMDTLGLRPPDFGVMTLIDAAPGSTQQELVGRSMIDASSMVAVIDELEGMGLVERRRHPRRPPQARGVPDRARATYACTRPGGGHEDGAGDLRAAERHGARDIEAAPAQARRRRVLNSSICRG